MQYYGYIKRHINIVRKARVCGEENRTLPFITPTAWQVLHEEHVLII